MHRTIWTLSALLWAGVSAPGCSRPAMAEDEGAQGSRQSAATAEAAPAEEATGQVVADDIMAQWKRGHPDRDWVTVEKEKHMIVPPADNSDLVGQGEQGSTYGHVTRQDVAIWERELEKLVVDGSRVFHSADALASQVGVSCDMCHPDGSNTHPETYPKFQVQMGRVAHLRDMINWCIENPVRGERLAPDSAEMRGLEAYILAQRKGEALNYGRR